MMKIKLLFLMSALCLMVITGMAQNTSGGKEKKSDPDGVGMNKSENRMTVRGTAETPKGVQVDTRSVEEIIGSAALCKYSVKLKDPAIFIEQGVCWGKNPGPAITDHKVSLAELNETVLNGEMTGLDADTRYYVRAFVTTTTGTVYGKELSFTTASGSVNSTYWIRRR